MTAVPADPNFEAARSGTYFTFFEEVIRQIRVLRTVIGERTVHEAISLASARDAKKSQS